MTDSLCLPSRYSAILAGEQIAGHHDKHTNRLCSNTAIPGYDHPEQPISLGTASVSVAQMPRSSPNDLALVRTALMDTPK